MTLTFPDLPASKHNSSWCRQGVTSWCTPVRLLVSPLLHTVHVTTTAVCSCHRYCTLLDTKLHATANHKVPCVITSPAPLLTAFHLGKWQIFGVRLTLNTYVTLFNSFVIAARKIPTSQQ